MTIDLQNCEIRGIDFHGYRETIVVCNPILYDRSGDKFFTVSKNGKPKHFKGYDLERIKDEGYSFLVPDSIPAFENAQGIYLHSGLLRIVEEEARRREEDPSKDLTPWQRVNWLSKYNEGASIAFGKRDVIKQRANNFASYLLSLTDEELQNFYNGGRLQRSDISREDVIYRMLPLAHHLLEVVEDLTTDKKLQDQAMYTLLLMAVIKKDDSYRKIWDTKKKRRLKTAIRRFRKLRSLEVSDDEINREVFGLHYKLGGQ